MDDVHLINLNNLPLQCIIKNCYNIQRGLQNLPLNVVSCDNFLSFSPTKQTYLVEFIIYV